MRINLIILIILFNVLLSYIVSFKKKNIRNIICFEYEMITNI